MAAELPFPSRSAARNMAPAERGGAEPGALIVRRVPAELPRRRAVGVGRGAAGGLGVLGGDRGGPAPHTAAGAGQPPPGLPAAGVGWSRPPSQAAGGGAAPRRLGAVWPGPGWLWRGAGEVQLPLCALHVLVPVLCSPGRGLVCTCGGAVCLGLIFERMKTTN